MPYFLADHTCSLIDRFSAEEAPYFIWHNFWGPHGPYYSPTEFVDRYRHVDIPPWPNYDWPSRSTPGPHHVKIHPEHESLTWEDWATAIRYYYAFTTLIDQQIGRIYAHLESTGQLENTVINSWPRMTPGLTPLRSKPFMTSRSWWQNPHAFTCTKASPGPGTGSGTFVETRARGPSGCRRTGSSFIARMVGGIISCRCCAANCFLGV